MFNVYPVIVRYQHTPNQGVLKGLPMTCTIGVESRVQAQRKVEELKQRNDGSIYSHFAIDYRR
mgnify:CR=1 FL=1